MRDDDAENPDGLSPDPDGEPIAEPVSRGRLVTVVLVGTIVIALAAFAVGSEIDWPFGSSEDRSSTAALELDEGACYAGELDGQAAADPDDEVDCDEPHDLEVYAVIGIQSETFPDLEQLAAEADVVCGAAFVDYVGAAEADTTVRFATIYPTEAGWDAGNTSVRCVLFDPDGQREGSARDLGPSV